MITAKEARGIADSAADTNETIIKVLFEVSKLIVSSAKAGKYKAEYYFGYIENVRAINEVKREIEDNGYGMILDLKKKTWEIYWE